MADTITKGGSESPLHISARQHEILEALRKRGSASNKELLEDIQNISRVTLTRDLSPMVQDGILIAEGSGRSVRYREREQRPLLGYVDVERYFEQGPDGRQTNECFNFEIFDELHDIFSTAELSELTLLNDSYRQHLAKLPHDARSREFERLTIDLSWKSSHIEGNTYSLIDTEVLIKENKEAAGHSREEAHMILNHKSAIEYIRMHSGHFKDLSIARVLSIHDIIVQDLPISRGIRTAPVGIVGTRYKPLANEHQIREAMEKMHETITLKLADPFSKALSAIALISYIQPFFDGNKRTARMVSDALLLAHDACPLSFRSVDVAEYKKALVLFYEQNNITLLKTIFIEQFRFAVENYFLA